MPQELRRPPADIAAGIFDASAEVEIKGTLALRDIATRTSARATAARGRSARGRLISIVFLGVFGDFQLMAKSLDKVSADDIITIT